MINRVLITRRFLLEESQKCLQKNLLTFLLKFFKNYLLLLEP